MLRTNFFLLMVSFLISYSPVQSQSFRLKHELVYSGELQVPFIKERTIENGTGYAEGRLNDVNNSNCYDFENDGIPEFFIIPPNYAKTEIDIYDGATCNLKYAVTIDSASLAGDPSFSLSFLDVDGDNVKELVGEFTFLSSIPYSTSGPTRLLIIDVKANRIKYSLDRSTGSTDGYLGYAFYDIDNDGFPEVICKWHSDSSSSHKMRIYGSASAGISSPGKPLAKQPSPVLKNMHNPISGPAKIEYYVSSLDNVLLTIFDSEGRTVRNLVDKKQPLGEYSIIWDGKASNGQSLAAGQYYYQLKIGSFISTKKMIAAE